MLSPESTHQPDSGNEPNIAVVLSTQARTRGMSELWTTAVGGSMNALLLLTEFRGFRWLAAGFLAVAAYGVWGLLDRRLSVLELENDQSTGARRFLDGLRGSAALLGFGAALYAVASFLTAALGGLSIPGR